MSSHPFTEADDLSASGTLCGAHERSRVERSAAFSHRTPVLVAPVDLVPPTAHLGSVLRRAPCAVIAGVAATAGVPVDAQRMVDLGNEAVVGGEGDQQARSVARLSGEGASQTARPPATSTARVALLARIAADPATSSPSTPNSDVGEFIGRSQRGRCPTSHRRHRCSPAAPCYRVSTRLGRRSSPQPRRPAAPPWPGPAGRSDR